MGAGIAASPHLHRPRICRCSLARRPEGLPLLDPGSPDQASLPVTGPARGQVQKPSAALLGLVPSRRLPPGGAANCDWKTNSSGASSGGPTWAETLLIAIRWRSVLPSPAAPSCRCRPSSEAGTSVPITHVTWPTFSSRESEKIESMPVDNGDIAHNYAVWGMISGPSAAEAASRSPESPIRTAD